MKIDVFNHYFPPKFFEFLSKKLPAGPVNRWKLYRPLYDLDARLRQVDEFPDYCQILSLSQPPINELGSPEETPALARMANDGLSEVCKGHPDHFPGFLAGLPMNNIDAAVKEIERCRGLPGFVGVQLHSNVSGRALDEPEFFPVFEKMAQIGKPVWLHPSRGANFPDYQGEKKSKYEIWWLFGWDYEITAAMARLVFGLVLDKLPSLKVIAHHMGGYVPQAEARINPHMNDLGLRTYDEDYAPIIAQMAKSGRKPIDYFKMFYADTALFGATAATRCGIEFFGVDKTVFASDSPFASDGGSMLIRDTLRALDELDLSKAARAAIDEGNAKKMIGMK
jgi:predicted TIM-barrel fold metal-dependent hydrolase